MLSNHKVMLGDIRQQVCNKPGCYGCGKSTYSCWNANISVIIDGSPGQSPPTCKRNMHCKHGHLKRTCDHRSRKCTCFQNGSLILGSDTAIKRSDSNFLDSVDRILSIHDGRLSFSDEVYFAPMSLCMNTIQFKTACIASGTGFSGGTDHAYLSIVDHSSIQLLPYLDSLTKFIHDGLTYGEVVFVHCRAGVSRSATVVIAYLMRYYGLALDDALKYVKNRRSVVNPNPGFMAQLWKYGAILRNTRSYPQ